MSTVAIYSFLGRYAGKAEYEYNYPEPESVHKCMLFLTQTVEDEQWDPAILECARYGFVDIAPDGFGMMIPAVLDEADYKGFRLNYDEALALGSSLIYYAA